MRLFLKQTAFLLALLLLFQQMPSLASPTQDHLSPYLAQNLPLSQEKTIAFADPSKAQISLITAALLLFIQIAAIVTVVETQLNPATLSLLSKYHFFVFITALSPLFLLKPFRVHQPVYLLSVIAYTSYLLYLSIYWGDIHYTQLTPFAWKLAKNGFVTHLTQAAVYSYFINILLITWGNGILKSRQLFLPIIKRGMKIMMITFQALFLTTASTLYEFYQIGKKSRTFDPQDIEMNLLGIGLGTLLFILNPVVLQKMENLKEKIFFKAKEHLRGKKIKTTMSTLPFYHAA